MSYDIQMKQLLISLTSVFFLVACVGNKPMHPITCQVVSAEEMIRKQDSTLLKINHDDLVVIPYDSMNSKIKTIKYCPFFTNKPIGVIDDVIVHKNRVIVMDAENEVILSFFDLAGNEIKRVDSKGNGPEEYVSLGSLSLSSDGENIVVYDDLASQLLYYNFEGVFQSKRRSVNAVKCQIYHDKGVHYTVFGQSYSREKDMNYMLTISKGDSIVRKGFAYEPIQIQGLHNQTLGFNQYGELLFQPSLSDTVYSLTSDSTYYARFVINHRRSLWKKKKERMTWDESVDLIKNNGFTYLNGGILETKDHIFYRISSGAGDRTISQPYYYDKKNQCSFAFSSMGKNSKLIVNEFGRPLTCYNNQFVGFLDRGNIDMLRDLVVNNGYSLENMELDALMRSKNIDNMAFMLVFYTFR